MNAAQHLSDGLAPLVDLLYPPRCPLCGDGLGRQEGLCLDCWGELEIPADPQCISCQAPLPQEHGGPKQCGHCVARAPLHAGIYAATKYNDASRKLILAFKHGRKIALARMLAKMMAARLPEAISDGGKPPLLVPVPLHPLRLWKRGYNQAGLLARELANLDKGELAIDALVRRKMTPSLGGLGQKEREKALNGAILARKSRHLALNGRDVILVDDVLTSGATSDICVSALLKVGARSVRIACFARVL
jgi:ComF family protein